MSTVISTPEMLEELAELVSMGNFPAARKLGRTLIKQANINHLWLIRRAADALESRPPRVAAAVLRQMWKDHAADKVAQAIIEACVPPVGEQRYRPEPATNSADYQPPQEVTHKTRADMIRARNSRQATADAYAFARYREERAAVADGAQILDRDDRTHAEQVYGSGFDYDNAALYGTSVELPCLACTISRERGDLDQARMKAGHGDDGLCKTCRVDGCPGVPALPEGHSFRDAINARCEFIFDACDDAFTALLALRSAWLRIKNEAVRAVIGDWVATNLPDEDGGEPPTELGTCAGCPIERTAKDVRGMAVDDGLCAECRALFAELAAEDEAAMVTVTEAPAPHQQQAGHRPHRAPSKRAQARAKRRRAAEQAARRQADKTARNAKRAAKRR